MDDSVIRLQCLAVAERVAGHLGPDAVTRAALEFISVVRAEYAGEHDPNGLRFMRPMGAA